MKLRDPARQLGGSKAEDYTASELPFVPNTDEPPKVELPKPIMLPWVEQPPEAPGWLRKQAGGFAAAVAAEHDTRSRLPAPGGLGGGTGDGTLVAALDGLRASISTTKEPVKVQGDVKGEATLMQSIKVDPSPLLIATVQGAQQALKLNLAGKLGQTMRGSNATIPSVAPGLTSFKPTVSGR